MKHTISIFMLILLTSFNAFGHETIDLLAGKIQSNGMPEGWVKSVDNNCTVKFQNRAIYFERQSPDEKCSFVYTGKTTNNKLLLSSQYDIDGNGYGILFNGMMPQTDFPIEAANGNIQLTVAITGEGKVWGWIRKLELTQVENAKSFSTPISTSELTSEQITKIKEIAEKCACAKYSWKDRGKAPLGYIKGMAISYAQSYLDLKTKNGGAVAVMSQALGDSKSDALAHYATTGETPFDRLRSVYTLATGLGMRESSGRTNVGWDKSKLKLPKPIQPTEENSEAGLFQVSWDSRNRSPYLLKLYEQYKSNPNKCQLETFSEGVKPKSEPV
ncbi:MAG: hypothetical protein ACK5NT_01790, partial [Pyrinomonadaceae bacterium]